MMAVSFFAETLRRPIRPASTRGQRARTLLRMFQIDGRRAHALLAVLVTAALALFAVFQLTDTEVVIWPEWSANAARAFMVVGPAFAAWSAMLASRDGMPNRVDLLASTATSRVRRELVQAAMGVLAALTCYGIVVACVLGYAARHATWGGPDWWVVLIGAATSSLYALFGWLSGTLAPGRLTPVVAGGAAFLFTVSLYSTGMTGSGSDAIQPWRYIEGWRAIGNRMFYDVSPYAGMPHPAGGVLIALGIAALLIVGYLLSRRALRSGVIALVAGALLLVPGWALANSTNEMPSAAPSLIANPPMSCGGEIVEVCLHRAYEGELDEAIAYVDAFYGPVAGLPGVPEVVTQQVLRDPPAGTLTINTGWDSAPIESVMGQPMGRALVSGTADPGVVPLNASQHAILSWLARQAGTDPEAYPQYDADVTVAAERFASLPHDERLAWLEANWDALRAGELTLEDMP